VATVTHRVAVGNSTGGNTLGSGSFSPASGDLLVAFCVANGSVDAGEITLTPTNGVSSFTKVDDAIGGPDLHTHYIFVADQLTTGTSSMSLTFDVTGDTATGLSIAVASVSDMTRVGLDAVKQSTVIDNGAGGVPPAFTFGTSCLTGNPTMFVLGNVSTGGLSVPTNWTEAAGSDLTWSSPTYGVHYCYRNSGFTGTTITYPSNETAHGGVAIELDTSSAGTDGTASPAVIAVTSTLPAATISGGGLTTPAAISAPVTLPTADGRGHGTTAPAAIAVTANLPAPTLSGGGTGTPATITTTVTLPAATLKAGGDTSPAVIPVTITLPAPTATGGGGGDGTATPAVIACTATLPAATTSGGGTSTPAALSLALTFPAASASGAATTSPAVIPLTVTAPSATTSGAGTATPGAIALVTTIPNPGISAGTTVNPATIALAITLAAALASGQGADENPITVTVTDYGHTVTVTHVRTSATAREFGHTTTATEVGSTGATARTHGTTTALEQG
jgi:hypothetical protein